MPLLADVAVEKRMWVQNFIGFSDLTSRACLRISFMSRTTGTAKSKRCRAYSDEFPGAVVVSDMLKERLDDVPVITHLSARGSNELERRDILAFYTAPSTELFAQFAALDARLGTRNSI